MTQTRMGRPAFTRMRWSWLLACFAPLMMLPMTASGDESDDQSLSFVFYPPAPDEPRLQYLTKFSTAQDVEAKSKGFRDFVFGGEEFEERLVTKPYGAAIYEGAIYVVDARAGGYAVFDVANGSTRFVRGSGAGAFAKPINITIDSDGTRYITDTQRNIILVYDRRDRFVRSIGEKDQFQPVDVAILGDRLYVTDVKNHKIDVIDKATGELIRSFGEPGSDPGELFHPTNIAVGEDGTVYVTETSNFRIQQFSAEGEPIRVIGKLGTAAGQFARPKGISLDRDGRIYVVDAAFGNVQVLDNSGVPLTFLGQAGGGPGGINLPTVVKIDYDNVEYFRKYAAPGFEIEYLVFVASQFGANKIAVFGFGGMAD